MGGAGGFLITYVGVNQHKILRFVGGASSSSASESKMLVTLVLLSGLYCKLRRRP